MGQQLPFSPKAQPAYGQSFPAAPAALPSQAFTMPGTSYPTAPGMGATGQQAPNPNAGIPGVDPNMMAQAQQSLAHPNAGDTNSILPSPKSMGLGMLGGLATAGTISLAAQNDVFNQTARLLDRIPGSKKLDKEWLRPQLEKLTENKSYWGKSFSEMMLAPAHVPVGTPPKEVAKHVETVMHEMEQRHLQTAVGKHQQWFNPEKKADPKKVAVRDAYKGILKEKTGIDLAYRKVLLSDPNTLKEAFQNGILDEAIVDGVPKHELIEKTPALKEKYIKFVEEKVAAYKPHNYLEMPANGGLALPETARFGTVVQDLRAQHNHLTTHLVELKKNPATLTKEQKATNKAMEKSLRQLRERISGQNAHYGGLYRSQAELTARLSAEGVGPIGRGFASSMNYLQRIFSGHTMGMGGNAAEKAASAAEKVGFWKGLQKMGPSSIGSLLGPLITGVTIFGFSFQAAHNAKEGEKKKTFFHSLFGSQIFNFIGWEYGRKVLNSHEFGAKLFGKAAEHTPLGALRSIPLIGRALAGITLGGLGTELVAMFLFGSIFQKVGEKLAHAIFGKPSQASIDGKGNNPNQQNPALAGMMNPALMNQALQQPGALPQQQAGRMAQSKPGQAYAPPQASIPAASASPTYPAAQPNMSPAQSGMSAAQPPATSAAPKAAAASPTAPAQAKQYKFSLTPQQISQSKVATDYDTKFKALAADKTIDKRTSELLGNL